MDEREIQAILAFHEETDLAPSLSQLSVKTSILPIGKSWKDSNLPEKPCELFILVVDAQTGISKGMIDAWTHFAERQTPRMMLVQGIEFSESDFDDLVLIGNRVLESFATPYLVLHDELGLPTGLISLIDGLVHDYSGSEKQSYQAEPELLDLVADFQYEYQESFQELGADGFVSGLYPIALPIGSNKKFGIDEANEIIKVLSRP